MSLHNEIEFESDICEYLAAHGWLYAEKDAADRKVFDSVIVVSDRNVIDGQLSEAIEAMQRNQGVVATIKGKSGSKSSELAEALSSDKKILVCKIQTFPYALEAVSDLAATKGKRFAVIADEAHSSQPGDTAAKLKAVLSAEELKELEDVTDSQLVLTLRTKLDASGFYNEPEIERVVTIALDPNAKAKAA